MGTATDAVQAYRAQYRSVRDALPGARLPWLAERREAGLEHFAAAGFPTQKVEAWKYTSLNALQKIDFRPSTGKPNGIARDRLPSLLPAGAAAHRLVFVDGRYRADLSEAGALPRGVALLSLAEALETRPELLARHLDRTADEALPLEALNTALTADGYVLHLEGGAVVETPIELLFLATGGDDPVAYHPRNLIVAEAGAQAVLFEQHAALSGGRYFANVVTEVVAERDAVLRHVRVQDEAPDAFHISTMPVRLAQSASFESFVLSFGAGLSRNEIRVELGGRGASCRLNGAYGLRGRQHADTTLLVEHASPDTASRQVYKGVLDDRARGVFQGKIAVHPDAQRIDGHQLSRALLLSEGAEVDTKPELEILADDVKCSHGAAAGELDEDALFYLRARGIPEADARNMLVEAFLAEAVEEVSMPVLREALQRRVARWLAERQEAIAR